MSGASDGTLFVHYPCFDGLVSGAIASDYLETNRGWTIGRIVTVNYDRQASWLAEELPQNSAVVDFLYHPAATFWADHHATTFLNDEVRISFECYLRERIHLYDRTAPSCAKLLWDHFGAVSSDVERYGEMAYWANRTDSAEYASVEEAIFGTSPALQINATLALRNDSEYGIRLLRSMRTMTLAQIAALPEVRSKADEVRERTEIGLRDIASAVRLEPSGIAVFEARPSENAIINRSRAMRTRKSPQCGIRGSTSKASTSARFSESTAVAGTGESLR